jgi:hypothetical protein
MLPPKQIPTYFLIFKVINKLLLNIRLLSEYNRGHGWFVNTISDMKNLVGANTVGIYFLK